jgi:hypothetical protein
MAKPIYIYLSRQRSALHEIYREGKPTGELVSNIVIKRFLNQDQYNEFKDGQQIFFVDGETFRKRYHKEKLSNLVGRSLNNFKFK